MRFCLVAGIGVSASLLWGVLNEPYGATILDDHLVYVIGYQRSAFVAAAVALAYLASTGLPLLLSSQRTILRLGIVVMVGAVVAYAFYWHAFISVWCFFAAAASAVILLHFEQSHRQTVRMAGV